MATDAAAGAECAVDYDMELTVVGRDTDTTLTPWVAADRSEVDLVAVFVDDGDGARQVRLARAGVTSPGPVSRMDLAAIPEGAASPAILRAGGGWLVAYRTPEGGIALQRFADDFTASGTAITIAIAGDAPALARIGTGAFVAWRDGTRLLGRPLSSEGTPGADAVELGALPVTGATVGIHGFGTEGGALAVLGSLPGTPAHAMGRTIDASGAAATELLTLGSTSETEGAVGVGDVTPGVPTGLPPLFGAAAFDVRVGGAFPEVRFVLVGTDGRPAYDEFTTSQHGDPSWGASVTAFRGGYVVAYRARPADGGFSRVELAFMDRDACRLGRVDAWVTAGVSASEQGSGTALAAQGSAVLVAWAETLVDVVEYRVAVARCPATE